MPKRRDSKIRLGRLELQIMTVVWSRQQASVHDVRDDLASGRGPAYSTILTMMRKLEAKGYLRHEVKDRAFIYHATISREDVRHNAIGDMLERLFNGSPSLLMASLAEQEQLKPKDRQAIRRLLDELAGEKGKTHD